MHYRVQIEHSAAYVAMLFWIWQADNYISLCVHRQMKSVKATNQELQLSLVKTSKATEKLSMERLTMLQQLDNQALLVMART